MDSRIIVPIKWNDNELILKAEYDKLEARCKEFQESNRILKVKLENKFKWLVRHSLLTNSISRAKAAELLEVPLIDLDKELDSITIDSIKRGEK